MAAIMTKKVEEEKLRLSVQETLESAELAARLGAEIAAQFGPRDETPLALTLRDASGALVAGLNGASHWRWFYVRHLWVEEAWRNAGLGRRLMQQAERVAQSRGCVGVYVDTFEPRAVRFYEGCGFARAGEIAGFPPGAARVFLAKPLSPERDHAA